MRCRPTPRADSDTDVPDRATRTSAWRTALKRVVLAAFVCAVALIGLLIGTGLLGVTGLSCDPHGYGVLAAILFAAVLTPIALALWSLYRRLRRGGS